MTISKKTRNDDLNFVSFLCFLRIIQKGRCEYRKVLVRTDQVKPFMRELIRLQMGD